MTNSISPKYYLTTNDSMEIEYSLIPIAYINRVIGIISEAGIAIPNDYNINNDIIDINKTTELFKYLETAIKLPNAILCPYCGERKRNNVISHEDTCELHNVLKYLSEYNERIKNSQIKHIELEDIGDELSDALLLFNRYLIDMNAPTTIKHGIRFTTGYDYVNTILIGKDIDLRDKLRHEKRIKILHDKRMKALSELKEDTLVYSVYSKQYYKYSNYYLHEYFRKE